MIKLVAFDWNGTLYDDVKIVVKADNFALKKLKQEPISISQFKNAFEIPIKKYWLNIGVSPKFLGKHIETLEKGFMEYYEKYENSATLKKGSVSCLKWLKLHKVNCIIYSNHITPHIQRQLKRLGITKFFRKVLARELGDIAHLHERGKGQKLYDYVKQKKYKPHEVVSIGDSAEEIETGKKHGFYTVGMLGGYNSTARLKKHHPDFLINNMLELTKIIKKLNK